jgi:hypothetical protein
MIFSTYNSRQVLLWSYALVVVGVIGVIRELIPQLTYSGAVDLGVLTGYGAIGLSGVATFVIGKTLRRLEEKLARLEALAPSTRGRAE